MRGTLLQMSLFTKRGAHRRQWTQCGPSGASGRDCEPKQQALRPPGVRPTDRQHRVHPSPPPCRSAPGIASPDSLTLFKRQRGGPSLKRDPESSFADQLDEQTSPSLHVCQRRTEHFAGGETCFCFSSNHPRRGRPPWALFLQATVHSVVWICDRVERTTDMSPVALRCLPMRITKTK